VSSKKEGKKRGKQELHRGEKAFSWESKISYGGPGEGKRATRCGEDPFIEKEGHLGSLPSPWTRPVGREGNSKQFEGKHIGCNEIKNA